MCFTEQRSAKRRVRQRRTAAWTRTAQHYARDYAGEGARTHAMGNLDLELVKDLLNGLHVGLQVFGFLRDIGQRCGKNHVQVEIQDAVHSVAGKRRLERCESARVGMELLSVFVHFVSISWLKLRRGTYFKRFFDALVQKHYV